MIGHAEFLQSDIMVTVPVVPEIPQWPTELSGCAAKIMYARTEIVRLEADVAAALSGVQIRTTSRYDAHTSTCFVGIDDYEFTPPLEWSVRIGSIVNSLRSALDKLRVLVRHTPLHPVRREEDGLAHLLIEVRQSW